MKVAKMSSVNKLGKRVSKDVVSKNPEKIRNNILTLDRTKKRLKEQILIIINFNVIIVQNGGSFTIRCINHTWWEKNKAI